MDAPVRLPALLVVLFALGTALAVTCGLQPGGRHTLLDQKLLRRIGAASSQPQVILRRTALVAMAFDQDRGAGKLAQKSFEQVTLTVTDANAGAVRLYQRLGFETFKTFGAFIYSKEWGVTSL